MSDTEEKKPAEAPAPKKGGGGLVGTILPEILAGAAAFGGARFAPAHAAAAAEPASAEHAQLAAPPGPTVALEPFLVVTQDASKKAHAMKMTLAVEFDATTKEESLKGLTPRIRDAALGYLRLLTYEDAIDSTKTDKVRAEMLEKFKLAGAVGAQRLLITDLVVQ